MEVYTGIYWYILSYTMVLDSRCESGQGRVRVPGRGRRCPPCLANTVEITRCPHRCGQRAGAAHWQPASDSESSTCTTPSASHGDSNTENPALRYLFLCFWVDLPILKGAKWRVLFDEIQALAFFYGLHKRNCYSNLDCSTVTACGSRQPLLKNRQPIVKPIGMASLHVALLALSIHEIDAQKRAAMYMLAHYYKSRSSWQRASIRRAKIIELCSRFCAGSETWTN